jgi:hypothetical protein
LEPEPGRRASAQIVIFPGVRRERHTDAGPRPDRRHGEPARPVRDILELPD